MITYPEIDPVIFSIGPLAVRWYGLMYVIGFIAAYALVSYQARIFAWKQLRKHLDNLNMALILGVILGGRLGYILFYNLQFYITHPVEIFSIWQGGMSFHGGCAGALLAGYFYCVRHNLNFWKAADLYVATAPIGLFFGRLGNFINAELFGRATEAPWGMIFPGGGPLPRHPSQLYEAFLEGIVLFCILWAVKSKPWTAQGQPPWPHGTLLGLFLFLYSIFRFMVEFVREPDPQVGLLFTGVSMGQVLSSVMCCMGAGLWYWRIRAQQNR